ncbi:hypothetical protein J4573_51550 [Actinomadura barringtoniae]|uniref:4-hydroxy-3-methylbut-2-enyl diphosphate reductase n=1 Tax=Actinomadura barringtoniae TaxID=1427535 RepID=A0A939PMM8_9ACTN|nr:hypothetical protein [Actinomadura barringtoniae]MBO2455591.1 hypothetical protein [Actinomadura barringtoniae]
MATSFVHPRLGPVRCDAAPLLAADLVASERPVRQGSVTVRDGSTDSDSLLLTVTYLDREAEVHGLGIAVRQDDPNGLTSAERLVRSWIRAVRSRRMLVVDTAPLCAGGRRGLHMMMDAAGESSARLFVIGAPKAAPADLATLASRGAVVTDDLSEVPAGSMVAFPAHGVPAAVRAEAAERGMRVVDATCPLVAQVQADAARYAARGDDVVVIGRAEHAVVNSLLDEATLVENDADVHALNGTRTSFVVDPGMPAEDAARLVATMREHVPTLSGHHFDAWCYASSNLIHTIRSVASASDVTLILGTDADTDADCRKARDIAAETCADVRVVNALTDISAASLARVQTVGLVPTLSARPGLVEELTDALSGLGPLSTVPRRLSGGTTVRENAADDHQPDVHDPLLTV